MGYLFVHLIAEEGQVGDLDGVMAQCPDYAQIVHSDARKHV